jgi:hypothetical protein
MKRLLATTLIRVLGAATSAAAGKAVIYSGAHGGDFPSKPEKLRYSNDETGGQGTLKLTKLDWEKWGSAKAISRATVKLCPESADCFTIDGVVKAKKLEVLDSIGYYRELAVKFGQNGIKFELPTP